MVWIHSEYAAYIVAAYAAAALALGGTAAFYWLAWRRAKAMLEAAARARGESGADA